MNEYRPLPLEVGRLHKETGCRILLCREALIHTGDHEKAKQWLRQQTQKEGRQYRKAGSTQMILTNLTGRPTQSKGE